MSIEKIRMIAERAAECTKEELREALVFALSEIENLNGIRARIPKEKTPVDQLISELPEQLCHDSREKLNRFFAEVSCELQELQNYTAVMQDKTNDMADRLEAADQVCQIAKELVWSPDPVGSHKLFELESRLKKYGG